MSLAPCIWKFSEESDLSGYTLLMPSVAVGNVGQLACDLLISSLGMRKIGSVYSSAMIPVVGYDPYDLNSEKLSSCCEIYISNARNIAVLQIRAPLIYKNAKSFLEDVLVVFKQKQIKEVVILTSSFAHEKKHIPTSSFRYVANVLCPHKSAINAAGWMEHENPDNGASLKIFGGGFATLLYHVATENDLPCFILLKYCSEGDNIPDAYNMIHELNAVLPLFEDNADLASKLIQPVSWKMLFGRPPPQDIY
ncbi:PAC2 family domain-containing protein [Phthorimaea operculella]|nr:PAC2 family domain-containing protein [Phthorimaea operculella]